MNLNKEPFEKIKNGSKIIELRLYDEKREKIKLGNTIEFCFKDQLESTIRAEVTALYLYKTFDEIFEDFPPNYFGTDCKENLIGSMTKYYSKEQENKFGVVGIRVKLI